MNKQLSFLQNPLTRRIALWTSAAAIGIGLMIPIQAASQPSPKLPVFNPQAKHLHDNIPSQAIEGQIFKLHLAWKDIPHAVELKPVALKLNWQDTSYDGKAAKGQYDFVLDRQHQKIDLIFQSSGTKQLQLLTESGEPIKQWTIDVKPYPASIFPRNWESYRDLPQDPKRVQIWANLYYQPQKSKNQRQYLQITLDNQIIERLLISSGALEHMTPVGEFSLGFKDYYPRSAKYNNTPMPFWSAINVPGHPGEFGFHSLEDGGYLYLLGRPASHGCLRMSRLPSVEKDPKTGQVFWGDRGGARWVYDRVPKESKVHIFRHPLPNFEFEDYEKYLIRQAKEAQQQKQDSKK